MARGFTVEVEREDDGRWIAEVTEIPGVLAYGADRAEALRNVEALALRVLADRIEHKEPAMPYDIQMKPVFGPLETVDAGRMADECAEPWWNRTLCRVNDSLVRIGVFHGEFHWHKHDLEDEYFHVVEGTLLLDLEDRTVTLGPRQGFLVPKGVVHRTRAPERTVVLMIEAATVTPTGD